MAESRALIKALYPGDQCATLIVNGNEQINAVCITIDPHNSEKVFFFLPGILDLVENGRLKGVVLLGAVHHG